MAHSKEQQDTYIAVIRRIMVMRGAGITGRDIVANLAKNNITISIPYAIKLRDKILGERKARVDRKLAALHVSDVEDTNEEVIRLYWDTVMDKNETTKNKHNALAKIAELKKATLDALMDAGIFTRHIGQEDHQHTVTPAMQAAIDCMMRLSKARAKPVIYQDAKVTESDNSAKQITDAKPNPNITITADGGTVDNKGGPMRYIQR